MPDVVALGELLIDFAAEGAGEDGYPVLRAQPGGAPANFLAALAKYGAKTALIGKVVADAFGALLLDSLRRAGIETRGVVEAPEAFTTLAFVTLDGRGERTFSFARKPGADTQLRAGEVDFGLIGEARCFHFGSLSLTDEPARADTRAAAACARAGGKLVTFDPNLRRPLWRDLDEARRQMLWGMGQADVVKLSGEEGEFLFSAGPERTARILLEEYGVALAFVTLGPEGCYCATRRHSCRIPAPAGIRPVDTTGAGDIFGGAAVCRLLELGKAPEALEREELAAAARFACAAAGLSTQRRGGIPSVPGRDEVEALLAGARPPFVSSL